MSVLSVLREEVGQVVDGLDAAALAPETAVCAVRGFAALERLAAAGKLLTIHRAVTSGGWRLEGARSEVHWLAKETGISFGHARSLIDAAAALTDAPSLASAVRSGALSEPQIRELAPAIAADPGSADELLRSANDEAFGKLKERCARVRSAAGDDAERYRKIKAARSLRTFQDPSGAGRIDAVGPPEVVARFRAALHPYRERAFARARAEGRKEPADAHTWDALVLWLDDQTQRETPSPVSSVVPTAPSSDPARPARGGRRRRRRNPDAEVIAIADLSALRRGRTIVGERCEIAGFGSVPVDALRDLIGDAALRIVLTDGVDVRTIAHSKRTINEHLQTALLASGWECDNPDCPNRHHLERDHVQALTNGGATALFNLRPKCKGGCHQAKTREDMAEHHARRGRSP